MSVYFPITPSYRKVQLMLTLLDFFFSKHCAAVDWPHRQQHLSILVGILIQQLWKKNNRISSSTCSKCCLFVCLHSQPKLCYNILNVLRQVTFQNKYSRVSDHREYCKSSQLSLSSSHCAVECSERRHIYLVIYRES